MDFRFKPISQQTYFLKDVIGAHFGHSKSKYAQRLLVGSDPGGVLKLCPKIDHFTVKIYQKSAGWSVKQFPKEGNQ